ncbi:Trp biosynthesis-associated membrane protein [Lacisediminihabitans changchengi]|uniref:Trp biosynthesis-associated membrane protein n=1 Tax=Lacisediminihabitans changchengi TaxID=2787634 RepID=A0A934SK39_9MICO|nr:Trp biosynthesis-associated membrane protein [Lacisediminihabitans changchengi]MBK4346809.1 Trp biosynthesis-associated membrane protein [Lacisediminihabitans changchengi]MBK4348068.1 Trp biosynthesis-associated membrane protein [Lacisediminihabitans changchengi]
MTPRRLKSFTMLAGVVLSGLTILTWTGQWFALTIDGNAATQSHLSAAGDVAAPALVTLALAGLALVGALAIAGPLIRYVLGAVQTLLGITVVLSAVSALRDPIAASASLITGATGVSGAAPVAALVRSVTVTAWPAVTIVVGALVTLLGVFLLITGRLWPASSRKYQTVRLEAQKPGENPAADWDSLSDGTDPTGDDAAWNDPTPDGPAGAAPTSDDPSSR